MRGMPTTMANSTQRVAAIAAQAGQTSQAPAIATACSASSINTRSGPGVATMICRLSPRVEKTDGRPIRIISAGAMSQTDNWAAAQGPETHAMTSTRKRSPDESGVSKGWLNLDCPAFSMGSPQPVPTYFPSVPVSRSALFVHLLHR